MKNSHMSKYYQLKVATNSGIQFITSIGRGMKKTAFCENYRELFKKMYLDKYFKSQDIYLCI